MVEILFQGAESVIYKTNNILVKERIQKKYRIKELDDKIIKQRTKKEVNILKKLNSLNISAPKLVKTYENIIEMEFIDGPTVKQLDEQSENIENVFFEIGNLVYNIHSNNIIHGDLTTSNFIFTDKAFIIDFGLSYISSKSEDKAVDLYVFEKSIRCAHDLKYLEDFYKGYTAQDGAKEVMERLELVRKRGRKREENP
ncbi:EKC/KEOPS complex subunit BUD32 [Nosema granulosis]|uniref:non-specific serine/threonine protein kinase n=1 Tax=Nosema granulosis TaxID=83296 RepID=A0A9P6GY38_9MICR|nr:EKC/KEOPS complex subunit BUD32 [Nosema granulosis]